MNNIWIVWDWELWMFTAIEAKKMWLDSTIIWDVWKASPWAKVVNNYLYTKWFDPEKIDIKKLKDNVDVLTIDSENISVDLLRRLEEEWVKVNPSSNNLYIVQNRLKEKQNIQELWWEVAVYRQINNIIDLHDAREDLWVGYLKTISGWCDWKWQILVDDFSKLQLAINKMDISKCIYEQVIDFKMEISVIVWRSKSEIIAFPPIENVHKNWILVWSRIPALIDTKNNANNEKIKNKAKTIAMNIAEWMWIEWLLTVEMFVLSDGRIIVSETAPRPHNSWQWTIESFNFSQYNILIKAILDEPFWKLELQRATKMFNLLWNNINLVPKRSKEGWKVIEVRDWNNTWYDYWRDEIVDDSKMWHLTKVIS